MKRLYRVNHDRKIAGVCGGLAEYFEVDPVIIRVAAVLLFLTQGIGFVAYIVMWVVLPSKEELIAEAGGSYAFAESQSFSEGYKSETRKNRTAATLMGSILIFVGSLFLVDNLFPDFVWENYLPVLLVFAGVAIIVNGFLPSSSITENQTDPFATYSNSSTVSTQQTEQTASDAAPTTEGGVL